MIIERYYFII